MPKKTNALDLINRLGGAEAALHGQEFMAPLLRDGRARLRLRGLIYELRVTDARPGWWCCRIRDVRHAEIVTEAMPWQRGDYLALWPALRLVLLEPLRTGAWLALPFNPADAHQRFGFAGPLPVNLVEGGQPFERIIGRVEGSTIWYDDVDHRADLSTAETLRTALAAEQEASHVAGLGAGEQAAYTLLLQQATEQRVNSIAARTERRLRHALEIGGAQLLGYELTDNGLRVTWQRNGRRSVTLVGTDLGVVSAGICLSGEDDRFDLTSIVGVIQDAPGFAR
ncbi:MAG: hypothetical protein ACLFVO_00485 [Chloroflexaceae bacterium]